VSFFSRISKSLKRAVRKLAPIASIVAPFIPAIGPLAGTILGAIGGSLGRTPSIRAEPLESVRPGIGPVRTVRRDRRRVTPAITRARAPVNVPARNLPPGHTPRPRGVGVTSPVAPRVGRRGLPVIVPPPIGSTRTNQMSLLAALPALAGVGARVAGTVGRALTGRVAAGAGLGVLLGQSLQGGAQGQQCPSGWHLNKQDGVGGPAGTYCVRNRRINVGNARAARRSVRRLKGARKLLKDIEKMMPSKPRPRRAPSGHTATLQHTGT